MRTFNVTFPKNFRVAVILVLYTFLAIVSFTWFIWDTNHGRKFGTYFLDAFFGEQLALFIALIAFKKYFSVSKTIELYRDRILIPGHEPDEILFKDIRDYKYGSYRGTTGISIKLVDGRKFLISGSALRKDNLTFVETLNSEIEQLILTGDLQLTKKLYAPFIESKWVLGSLVCYSVFLFAFFQYFNAIPHFKVIMVINCFIAFIVWVTYSSVKLTNASRKWYQSKDTPV